MLAGDEVWVYECPQSPKRGSVLRVTNDNHYVVQLHGFDVLKCYPAENVFKFPYDKNVLKAAIHVDITYLKRYIDSLE